jgi:hypothetical protein
VSQPARKVHLFILRPPRSLALWSPWKCLCGFGQTGADDDAALAQYEAHVAWEELVSRATAR